MGAVEAAEIFDLLKAGQLGAHNMADWNYVGIADAEMEARVRDLLGALVVIHPETGMGTALGTVFPIGQTRVEVKDGVFERHEICVTAAHVLVEGFGHLPGAPPKRTGMSPLFRPPDTYEHVNTALTEGRLQVLFNGRPPRAFAVTAISLAPEGTCDLGMIAIRAAQPDQPPPPLGFCLDSDWLPAGTHIIAAGCDKMQTSKMDDLSGRFEFLSTVGVRTGEIIEVIPRAPFVNCTAYRTNIALPHGWSGGPALLWGTEERPMAAVGVISSGNSTRKAETDPDLDSHSLIIPTVWLYALWFPGLPDLPFAAAIGEDRIRDIGKNASRIIVKANRAAHLIQVQAPDPPLSSPDG